MVILQYRDRRQDVVQEMEGKFPVRHPGADPGTVRKTVFAGIGIGIINS